MYINCCAEALWIAAETGLPAEVVHTVLIHDLRYLQLMGVAEGPETGDHEIQVPEGSR